MSAWAKKPSACSHVRLEVLESATLGVLRRCLVCGSPVAVERRPVSGAARATYIATWGEPPPEDGPIVEGPAAGYLPSLEQIASAASSFATYTVADLMRQATGHQPVGDLMPRRWAEVATGLRAPDDLDGPPLDRKPPEDG